MPSHRPARFRRRDRKSRRPAPGRSAASRGRKISICPDADSKTYRSRARGCDGVGSAAVARSHHGLRTGATGEHVRANIRAALSRRDWNYPASLAHATEINCGATLAGNDAGLDRRGRRSRRLRYRRDTAASLPARIRNYADGIPEPLLIVQVQVVSGRECGAVFGPMKFYCEVLGFGVMGIIKKAVKGVPLAMNQRTPSAAVQR